MSIVLVIVIVFMTVLAGYVEGVGTMIIIPLLYRALFRALGLLILKVILFDFESRY